MEKESQEESVNPEVPPEYLDRFLSQEEAYLNWINGEIDVWEMRLAAAEKALKELRAIKTGIEAAICSIEPAEPSAEFDFVELQREIEQASAEQLERMSQDTKHQTKSHYDDPD